MIEIKDAKYDPSESVQISASKLKELIEAEELGLQFYQKLKVLVLQRYVENYACFGNGGAITYEELASLLRLDLPNVAHIGVDKWLEIKSEVGAENG